MKGTFHVTIHSQTLTMQLARRLSVPCLIILCDLNRHKYHARVFLPHQPTIGTISDGTSKQPFATILRTLWLQNIACENLVPAPFRSFVFHYRRPMPNGSNVTISSTATLLLAHHISIACETYLVSECFPRRRCSSPRSPKSCEFSSASISSTPASLIPLSGSSMALWLHKNTNTRRPGCSKTVNQSI